MSATELPISSIPGLRASEITPDHEADLQRFFEANPEYFWAVNGEPAGSGEAHEEISSQPPPGWSYTKQWQIGYREESADLVAMAQVVSDLLSPGVWHIGLFIVATARHGTGMAQTIYGDLEKWAASHGASWMRLGIVLGNGRAERFWEKLGYIETRTREGVEMGKRTNTIRVMIKPLHGGSLDDYRRLVPRDVPEKDLSSGL